MAAAYKICLINLLILLSFLQSSLQNSIKSQNDFFLKSMTKPELNYYFDDADHESINNYDFELIEVPVKFWDRTKDSFNATFNIFGDKLNFNFVKNVKTFSESLQHVQNSSDHEILNDYHDDCHYLSISDDNSVALSNCVKYEIVSLTLLH